jgi:hypothetical protein
MINARPSILTRPLHRQSRCNEESADVQFEKEAKLLDLKRRKHQETEELQKLARQRPTSGNSNPLLGAQALSARLKAERQQRDSQEERRIAELQLLRLREEEEAEALRKKEKFEANRRVQEANKLFAQEREERLKQQRQREQATDNANLKILLSS